MEKNRALKPVILVAAVFISYFNAYYASFQFDDFNVIVNNAAVHSPFAWFAGLPSGIRPLLKLTYALNWSISTGPALFHVFNVMVHAVNVLLVYVIAARFLEKFDEFGGGRGERAAFFAALLFALHPVHTEAVTYIIGRSASLSATFYLGSILAYDKGGKEGRGVFPYMISPLFFIASVGVKETAVTLPLALVLWDACGREGRGLAKAARRQAGVWAVFILILLLIAANKGYNSLISSSVEERSLGVNLLSELNGVTYLVSRYLFIHSLNIDPDLPVIAVWGATVAIEAAFFLAIFVLGVFNFRKRPWLSFGIIWFFLQMLPANSVIPRLDIANERHLYLASFGVFLALAAFAVMAAGRIRASSVFFRPAALLLFITLSAFTVSRNRVYRSEAALWEDTAKKSPEKARVHNNLGYAYSVEGRIDDAKRAYEDALKLNPDFKTARNNLEELLKGSEF